MSNPPFNPQFGGLPDENQPESNLPQQPQHNGGFPQQPQQSPYGQQQNGFPPQQQSPYGQQQQQFPYGQPQQQSPYGQPQQQFGQEQNAFPPQQQQFPYGQQQFGQGQNNGGFPPLPQGSGGGSNKKILIIIGSILGFLVLVGVIIIVLAVSFVKGLSAEGQNIIDDPYSSSSVSGGPINFDPVTATDNVEADTLFNQTYDAIPIDSLTRDEARGVALDTCAYMMTSPTKADFSEELLAEGDNYDVGVATGIGVAVYCPELEKTFYELMSMD